MRSVLERCVRFAVALTCVAAIFVYSTPESTTSDADARSTSSLPPSSQPSIWHLFLPTCRKAAVTPRHQHRRNSISSEYRENLVGIRVQHLRCNVSISTAIRRRTGEKGAWVEAKHAVNRLLKGLVQAECHDHFCSNETRPVDVDDDGQFPPDAFSLQTRQRGAAENLDASYSRLKETDFNHFHEEPPLSWFRADISGRLIPIYGEAVTAMFWRTFTDGSVRGVDVVFDETAPVV
ncbi:unnamed protein product [Heligmosomoides polygyrus]|uniref:SCP domain-containing protein n=1 Tax=Heligmosomoides polygyrus TaxID=6339 RepID=A0A3P7WMF0_HELPZ|nr:unnamed protein product [Heligmosomoides polygyrus]